jgi:glycosyltransferase involved in cell wall biosynthesis
MQLLLLTRYERLGSSSRVRFYQYLPYLKSRGVQVVNAAFFDDEYVRRLYSKQSIPRGYILQAYLNRLSTLTKSAAYDWIWVEKELIPWFPAWFEHLFSSRNIPYAVDYDDAVFHRYDKHPSALIRLLLGRKIDAVMQRASLVIAGNEYLAGRARQAGAKWVEILPSVVDVERYKLKTKLEDQRFKIGWIGSPVTAPYLDVIRDALQTFARETEVQLTLIGSGTSVPFDGVPTTVLPWSEDLELSIGEMFDVGIMPLVDGPFERGKCGYKLVQYMAAGLPVIASPVGVNSQMVNHGLNGYLANSRQEWLGAFRELSRNAGLRQQMGRSGRQQAEQKYNLKSTAPRLFDLLSSVRRAR